MFVDYGLITPPNFYSIIPHGCTENQYHFCKKTVHFYNIINPDFLFLRKKIGNCADSTKADFCLKHFKKLSLNPKKKYYGGVENAHRKPSILSYPCAAAVGVS